MVIRIPRPSDVLGAAHAVAGLPSRTAGLVEDTLRLLARVNALVDKADLLLSRADRVLSRTEQTVTAAGDATRHAEEVIGRADTAAGAAQRLLDLYGPTAEVAAPLARQFVEQISEREVHAAIRLIDQVPEFAEHMEQSIMPILATLDRVGPDVHELLDVTRDLRQAILGMPGFEFFRRRGEDREDNDE